jgi:hypothetical protein
MSESIHFDVCLVCGEDITGGEDVYALGVVHLGSADDDCDAAAIHIECWEEYERRAIAQGTTSNLLAMHEHMKIFTSSEYN